MLHPFLCAEAASGLVPVGTFAFRTANRDGGNAGIPGVPAPITLPFHHYDLDSVPWRRSEFHARIIAGVMPCFKWLTF